MNIKDLMTDDAEKLTEFAAECDDMCNSQYILAEGKIIKLLQTVAISTLLQKIICESLNGFDYAASARKCLRAGKIQTSSRKEHIALTFCILADIDGGKILLNDFLRKFFYNGDINTAYSSFCETLIVPFKNYILSEEPQNDYKSLERKAMDLAAAIEKYGGYLQNEKEEYIFMCDNIASKARSDLSGARALAIGLKKSIGDVPELMPYLTDMLGELDA